MDQKAVAFARSWATRYVRTKHPHGLDEGDVENRILESLYKNSRGKMCGRDGYPPAEGCPRSGCPSRGARPSQNRKDGLSPVRDIDETGPSKDGEANVPQWMMEALSEALNEIQNESRRNLRALCPWQIRNAEPHLETQAYRNLACDMQSTSIRQGVRENDRRCVRLVLNMLSPEDRRLADEFMALGSWRKVAARRGMSEGTFRRRVLADFVSRFKEAWRKIS